MALRQGHDAVASSIGLPTGTGSLLSSPIPTAPGMFNQTGSTSYNVNLATGATRTANSTGNLHVYWPFPNVTRTPTGSRTAAGGPRSSQQMPTTPLSMPTEHLDPNVPIRPTKTTGRAAVASISTVASLLVFASFIWLLWN